MNNTPTVHEVEELLHEVEDMVKLVADLEDQLLLKTRANETLMNHIRNMNEVIE